MSKPEVLLTIFIPTYKRCHTLHKAIKSILDKKWNINYEIFICESGDSVTKYYLDGLKKKYKNVKYISQDKPTGTVSALNDSLNHFRGKYFIIMCDDCIISNQVRIGELIFEMMKDDVSIYGITEYIPLYDQKNTTHFWRYKDIYVKNFNIFDTKRLIEHGGVDKKLRFWGLTTDIVYGLLLDGYTMRNCNDVVLEHHLKDGLDISSYKMFHRKSGREFISKEMNYIYQKYIKITRKYPPVGKQTVMINMEVEKK